MDQNQSVFHDGFHTLGIGHEIRGQVTTVELHTFHSFQAGFHGFGFFDGNNAFFADFFHSLGNNVADGFVAVGGNGTDLSDFLVVLDRLGQFLQAGNSSFNSFVDAALDFHGVVTRGDQLDAFAVNGLGQYGSGSGTITGHVRSLGSDFLDQLSAHIFKLAFQFDFLGDGYAVLGDQGSTERTIDHNVTALGTQSNLNSIGQLIDTAENQSAGILSEFNFFGRHIYLSSFG